MCIPSAGFIVVVTAALVIPCGVSNVVCPSVAASDVLIDDSE